MPPFPSRISPVVSLCAPPDAASVGWPPEKRALYEFVVRIFLAACSLDAVGYETTAAIDIAGERTAASAGTGAGGAVWCGATPHLLHVVV